MRILHIMAGRGNGGAETYAADMVLALHADGVEQVAVWHPHQARLPELRAAGVRIAPDILRQNLGFLQRAALRHLLRTVKPDLIHCWMRRAASIVPSLPSQPVIGWFGGYYDVRHFKNCSYFIGVTPDIVTHQHRHGVATERCYFVPTFPTLDLSPALDRATLTTPSNAKILLALSRLHPKKGLDILLQALAQLPDCYLWLAGDGPLLPELRRQAAQLGVAERVRFLGWRHDRGALLRAADICVLPSRYEPFGTVMLEAWAAHVPLVAAAAAGPAAFVRHEANGMLVAVDDATALGQAIRNVLDRPALRATIIAGGRATYEAQFTRPAVMRQLRGVYEKILATQQMTGSGG